jgi:hypothetical protein
MKCGIMTLSIVALNIAMLSVVILNIMAPYIELILVITHYVGELGAGLASLQFGRYFNHKNRTKAQTREIQTHLSWNKLLLGVKAIETSLIAKELTVYLVVFVSSVCDRNKNI